MASARKSKDQLTMFDALPANGNGGHVNLTIKPIGKRKRAPTGVFTIYRHTHRESQKCYVGQTTMGMEKRWRCHVQHASKGHGCRLFSRAIVKHGADAFDHEVLETVASLEEANETEIWWIAHFGSDDPTLGYNLDHGGNAKSTSQETRARQCASQRARWNRYTPEQRQALADALTHEQRSAIVKAQHAKRTPEQRSEEGRRRQQSKTPEQRKEEVRKGVLARTPEERRAASLRAWDTRRANGNVSTTTKQQNHDKMLKSWATRRANAAAAAATVNDVARQPSTRINLLRELPAPAAKKEAA